MWEVWIAGTSAQLQSLDRYRDRVLVNIQSNVSAILFHGLSSLLVALSLRLVRAESSIHVLKVGQASIHNVYLSARHEETLRLNAT